MRLRIGKWVLVWESWLPRIVRYVNLGEWKRTEMSEYEKACWELAQEADDKDDPIQPANDK